MLANGPAGREVHRLVRKSQGRGKQEVVIEEGNKDLEREPEYGRPALVMLQLQGYIRTSHWHRQDTVIGEDNVMLSPSVCSHTAPQVFRASTHLW